MFKRWRFEGVEVDFCCPTLSRENFSATVQRAVRREQFLKMTFLCGCSGLNALVFTLDQQISCKLTYRAAPGGCLQVGASFC